MKLTVLLVLTAALSPAPAAFALHETIAFGGVEGPKEAGAEQLARGLREGLAKRGLYVVPESVLKRAASKRSKHSAADQAQRAGADLVLTAELSKQWRGFVAHVRLARPGESEPIFELSRPYPSAKKARRTGALLARLVAGAAGAEQSEDQEDEDEVEPRPVVRPAAGEHGAEEEAEEPSAKARGATLVPRDEQAPAAQTQVQPGGAARAEERPLRIGASLGSQLRGAYAVSVAGTVTGHTHLLAAAPLLQLQGRWAREQGLGLEASVAWVPLKYRIQLSDRPEPLTPSATALELAAFACWRLPLGSSVVLAPLAGLSFESLSIAEADEMSAVVGSKSLALHGGGRFELRLGEDLALELTALARLIPFYAESPTTTGQGGAGYGVRLGAQGRYWLTGGIAALAELRYDYAAIGFSGIGSRVRFADDPPLIDARADLDDLRVSVGFAFAP